MWEPTHPQPNKHKPSGKPVRLPFQEGVGGWGAIQAATALYLPVAQSSAKTPSAADLVNSAWRPTGLRPKLTGMLRDSHPLLERLPDLEPLKHGTKLATKLTTQPVLPRFSSPQNHPKPSRPHPPHTEISSQPTETDQNDHSKPSKTVQTAPSIHGDLLPTDRK